MTIRQLVAIILLSIAWFLIILFFILVSLTGEIYKMGVRHGKVVVRH